MTYSTLLLHLLGGTEENHSVVSLPAEHSRYKKGVTITAPWHS